MKVMLSFLFLATVFAGESMAQYYGQRSLEKSFEQNNMFFQPSYISPYGIGSFALATPGLIDDALLDLQVNPAWVSRDTAGTSHLYLDFRSYRQTASLYQPIVYRAYGPAIPQSIVYPYYFVNSRPIIEPILSAAFLANPLPSRLPGLFVGVTYQAIMQDSKYYTIPFDIYQTSLGYNYRGVAVANSSAIPITTVSSGQDNMHHTGNLFSLYTAYKVSPDLTLGLRLGRVLFDENGSYGNNNYWDNSSYGSGSSLYYSIESRSQNYNHWDLSGGVQYGVTAATTVGITGGYLWGHVGQDLSDRDSSYYSYGTNNLSVSSGTTREHWNHDGKTYYGGVDIVSRLNDHQTLTFVYQFNRENVDIGLNSAIVDTSHYTYSYSSGTDFSNSLSNSAFVSNGGGGGSTDLTTHRFLLSLKYRFGKASDLNIGGILYLVNQATNTNEPIVASGHSYYNTTGSSYNSLYYDTTYQNKNLQWSFSVKKWSFDIPIIFNYRFSEMVSMLLGIDKQISEWKMTDNTLVIYYRNRDNNSGNGLTDKSNYGELYSSPVQDISDVSTTFLAGLTVSPSRQFNVRFLMSPSIRATFENLSVNNFQWWIGVNLYP